MVAALTTEVVTLTTDNSAHATEISAQATEITALTTEVAALKIANAPAHTNDFISTIDFKRHLVVFVHIEMLLVLREVCKEWNEVVKEVVDESVESDAMMVHGVNDISTGAVWNRKERRKLVLGENKEILKPQSCTVEQTKLLQSFPNTFDISEKLMTFDDIGESKYKLFCH
ncbi:hypothetical protein TrLO_g901 [Triparma laevis f. longispina]|uniref:Uncharacterized protein n=1 Tax=Triparma laevis f. longispina TaxID=1714387 RepID=A0A9W6ZUH9_9STRA|nr:hypothetical protein TrLO_g901 [Triparma laevis f. longispina]